MKWSVHNGAIALTEIDYLIFVHDGVDDDDVCLCVCGVMMYG